MILAFLLGLIAGGFIGSVWTFKYLDRELLKKGIDVVGDFDPPQAKPIACGFESEL